MKRSGIEDTNASNLDYASLHRGYLTDGWLRSQALSQRSPDGAKRNPGK